MENSSLSREKSWFVLTMSRRGSKGILERDLGETILGGLILRLLIPLSISAYGGWTLLRGRFTVQNTVVDGLPAIFYGLAFVVFGIGAFDYPTMAEIEDRKVPRSTKIRMWGGFLLFGLLLGAATVSQLL